MSYTDVEYDYNYLRHTNVEKEIVTSAAKSHQKVRIEGKEGALQGFGFSTHDWNFPDISALSYDANGKKMSGDSSTLKFVIKPVIKWFSSYNGEKPSEFIYGSEFAELSAQPRINDQASGSFSVTLVDGLGPTVQKVFSYTMPYGSPSHLKRKVTVIASGGKEEVNWPTRTISSTVSCSDWQMVQRGLAGVKFETAYGFSISRFSLDVEASGEFSRSISEARNKALEAFATKKWTGLYDPGVATELKWDGQATYTANLSSGLLSTIGTPTYKWSLGGGTGVIGPYEYNTNITFESVEWKEGYIDDSTQIKRLHHDVGDKNWLKNSGSHPTKTQIRLIVSGSNAETGNLTAKAKIDWYPKPQTRLRAETYVLVTDYDAGGTVTRYDSLEAALQGSPEEQQIDAYIAEIQAAYKETIDTGSQLVGTALEIEMAVGSWYVPDETDAALFVVGGVSKKIFKIAKNSAKFTELVTKVGQKLASKHELILAALKAKHSGHNIRVEVREALYAEERVGHAGVNGIRSNELPAGHVAHEESGKIEDKIICELGSGICFVKGTLVASERGLRAIETIQKGDLVWSRDETTGQTQLKPVKQTFVKQAPATLVLTFSNGETIETTPGHPFFVESRGFVKAGELGIGTSIVTRAGPSVTLASTSQGKAQVVYNFEVEDFHTYFVGKCEAWVHNQCDLEGEAHQHADHIRDTWPTGSRRPTTADAIEIPPLPPFKGHNFKEGMDWSVDEDVARLYDNVPLGERNPYYHAKCAEVQALSAIFAHYKAQGLSGAQIEAMLRQNGGRSVAVQIGGASHGTKKPACESCAAVLRGLGLTF